MVVAFLKANNTSRHIHVSRENIGTFFSSLQINENAAAADKHFLIVVAPAVHPRPRLSILLYWLFFFFFFFRVL
jgi:hypothetical protein